MMHKNLILAGLAAVAVAATPSTGRAQTALTSATPFTYDGLTVSVSGCSFTLVGASTACTNGALNGVVIQGVSSVGGASLEVMNSLSGPLLSVAAGSGLTELKFTLTIVAPSTKTKVDTVTNTLNGNAPLGKAVVTSTLTEAKGGTSLGPANVASLNTPVVTNSFTAFNPTAAAPLTLNVDLKLDATSAANGGLTITNAIFKFSPAPEPASIGLLALGLGGVAAARRKLRHRSQPI